MASSHIFTDTSAWYAYIDKSDANHAAKDESKAWEIFVQYEDKGFSFTDCTSFAIMERLKIDTAFVFDDHFIQYGKFIVIPT